MSSLLFRPGFLSTEYFAGRRVRYIPPVRLYFTTSILFFVVYTLVTFFSDGRPTVQITSDQTEVVALEPTDQSNESTTTDNNSGVENEKDPLVAGAIDYGSDFTWLDGDPSEFGMTQEQADKLKARIRSKIDKTKEKREANSTLTEGSAATEQEDDFSFNLTDDEINIPGISQEEIEKFESRMDSQIKKAKEMYALNPDFVGDYLREVAPPIIFCLLPLFALLLKIVYVFKGMFYTQHLVLAVHNHCFVFFWLTIHTLVNAITVNLGWFQSLTEIILLAWVPWYLWRSLRVVYGQGVFLTLIKFLLLSSAYGFLIGLAAIGAILFGVLTL